MAETSPPVDGWRSPSEEPPFGTMVELRLTTGRLHYALWNPPRQRWETTGARILSSSVEAWRPAPRVR